jgi:hypothetical protein
MRYPNERSSAVPIAHRSACRSDLKVDQALEDGSTDFAHLISHGVGVPVSHHGFLLTLFSSTIELASPGYSEFGSCLKQCHQIR